MFYFGVSCPEQGYTNTMNIGIIPRGSDVWGQHLLKGIFLYAQEHEELSLNVLPMLGSLNVVLPRNLDGLVCSLLPEEMGEVERRGIPYLNLRMHQQDCCSAELWTDDPEVVRLAVQHLEERGCIRMASFADRNTEKTRERNLQVMVHNRLEELGLEDLGPFDPPPEVYAGGWTYEKQLSSMETWLAGLPKPLGLICTNGEHARRALEAIRRLGLEVPGDIFLLSLTNSSHLLEYNRPSITTMDLNLTGKGVQAARLIHELVEGKRKAPFREWCRPKGVIPRESTAYAVTYDPQLNKVLKRMKSWEYDMPSIDELARYGGMSKRNLFRKIKDATGRSPSELLYRCRIEKALNLLRNEQMGLSEVADQCGYGLPSQLSREIKQSTGLTPTQYRSYWKVQ